MITRTLSQLLLLKSILTGLSNPIYGNSLAITFISRCLQFNFNFNRQLRLYIYMKFERIS